MFQEYKKILIPVDGSRESKLSFRKAVEVAKRNKAAIIITHIIDTRAIQTPTGFEGSFTDEIVRQSKTLMEEYKIYATNEGITDVQTVIEYGSPKAIIAKDLPAEYGVDLIMIGATGLNAIERVFIGSVSEYVIRNAPCDVLVVRTDLENKPKTKKS